MRSVFPDRMIVLGLAPRNAPARREDRLHRFAAKRMLLQKGATMSFDRSSNRPAIRSETIRALCRHCDVEERLPLIPPSAKVRGIYFGGIDRTLAKAGCLDRFKALFPP